MNIVSSIESIVGDIVSKYVHSMSRRMKVKSQDILGSLEVLLGENYKCFNFTLQENPDSNITLPELDMQLSNINEKQSDRKSKGVYYTPKDLTKFMVANQLINYHNIGNKMIYSYDDAVNAILLKSDNINKTIFDTSVLDPTCGSGEFLISMIETKIDLIIRSGIKITTAKILRLANTIHGNDIKMQSVDIAKLRIFFAFAQYITGCSNINELAEIVKNNFTNFDFVNLVSGQLKKFNIIIGNPPYVENRHKDTLVVKKYGNIYADVLHNSVDLLDSDGVFAFVVPVSYVSTGRMDGIRMHIAKNTKKQFLLNYADRPDCLFTSVHQKLTIIIACKKATEKSLFTSGYKHWYKIERQKLFKTEPIYLNNFKCENFIPKIGNEIEASIFAKLFTNGPDNILHNSKADASDAIYLNMRGTFWIKAFTFNPGSSEYKKFMFDDNLGKFVLCILNSGLFYIYWNIVSDCWHITNKELSTFKFHTENINLNIFAKLYKNLEAKLEKTKQYVGTKQVDYVYKHRECLKEIKSINIALADIYGITQEELKYIENYNLKYRVGGGKNE